MAKRTRTVKKDKRTKAELIIKLAVVNVALSVAEMRRQALADDFQGMVADNSFIQSMSGRGNCYDNAAMESFFKTLKTELIRWEKYATRNEAKKSIFEYIEVYYNRNRMHSSIGYMSPVEFETLLN